LKKNSDLGKILTMISRILLMAYRWLILTIEIHPQEFLLVIETGNYGHILMTVWEIVGSRQTKSVIKAQIDNMYRDVKKFI
jgi:hypothetical protein